MDLKYFKLSEFDCQETGQNEMKDYFLTNLDLLRETCGFPFKITSGYRSPIHSIEQRKAKPGTHAQGIAADIEALSGSQKFIIVNNAIRLGFTGIGVAKSFIHLDMRAAPAVMWTY